MDADVLVVGGGHAGIEAAHAVARLGLSVILVTFSREKIGEMPCNPAIGGIAKGHLVREIDALGGLMARAIDATGIQFRVLNRSRGPAVQGPRAQADKAAYSRYVRGLLEGSAGVRVLEGEVGSLLREGARITGVRLADGEILRARATVVATGTFLNGLIHVGMTSSRAGRAGEPASMDLADSIARLGLPMGRLKTGTPPRVHRNSIDYSRLEPQFGDDPPRPFSYSTPAIHRTQVPCHLGWTTPEVAEVIRRNLDQSPLYSGRIQGVGPRYCPSIEDKVVKFPHRERHQVFLEPEGLETDWMYVNGLSTSLPETVQAEILEQIPGFEGARILRAGYAVEYDFVQPTALHATLAVGAYEGLYLAGQINGTSGYEEAAAQGLVAGANAALRLLGRPPLILNRHDAYIGILVDDLTRLGTSEPYRMFTSRAEYRLHLRADNADDRLAEIGWAAGMVDIEAIEAFRERRARRKGGLERARSIRIEGRTIEELVRQPEVRAEAYSARLGLDRDDLAWLNAEIKYAGYLKRERLEIDRLRAIQEYRLPGDLDFAALPGLSREIVEKLQRRRPGTLGEARAIPGVTPAAIECLACFARRPAAAGPEGEVPRGTPEADGKD